MELLVSRCPYCLESRLLLDDGPLALGVCPNPETRGECDHLAFASVSLTATVLPPGIVDAAQCSRLVLWILGGGGMWMPTHARHPLREYIEMLARDLLPDWSDRPKTAYRIVGGTAQEREEGRRGSGKVRWTVPGIKGWVQGLLDGCGVYSWDPTALVVEVKQLAYRLDSPERHGQDSEPLLPRPS
jgi:hypothetical protein